MAFDEIDDALRRQPMWEPPADFSRQAVAIAVRLPASPGLLERCSATVSGYVWMLRQYWALLAR